jgi:hypothetical protein
MPMRRLGVRARSRLGWKVSRHDIAHADESQLPLKPEQPPLDVCTCHWHPGNANVWHYRFYERARLVVLGPTSFAHVTYTAY